jgi:hypothetical protein
VFTVIDDVLPEDYALSLEGTMLCNSFPYYFFQDVDYGNTQEIQYNFGYVHNFCDRFSETRSEHLEGVIPVAFAVCDKMNLALQDIIRIRGVMLNPVGFHYKHKPHVDIRDFDGYWTAIYYVNDSDGDTEIIVDGTIHRVQPKRNRAVVFKEKLMHNATKPIIVPARVVLNINFMAEEKYAD